MQAASHPPMGFMPRQKTSSFIEMCGPVYEKVEDGRLVALAVQITDKHRNLRGIAHGGMLMTLADSAMGDAISHWNEGRTGQATASMSCEFFKPAQVGDWVFATVHVNRVGKRLGFAECKLLVNDEVIFRASGVFAIMAGQTSS